MRWRHVVASARVELRDCRENDNAECMAIIRERAVALIRVYCEKKFQRRDVTVEAVERASLSSASLVTRKTGSKVIAS